MTLTLNLRQEWCQRLAMLSLIVVWGIPAHCQTSAFGNGNIHTAMPEYIQEFFLSDTVRCQEKGEIQFTTATQSRHSVGTSAELHVEYGITDRLQFAIETPFGIVAQPDQEEIAPGWSSVNVGFLYQLIRSDRPLALSAGVAIDIPLHAQGELGYEPAILFARSFHKLQVHGSVISQIERSESTFAYNLAAVFPIKHGWFPTLEFNGRHRETSAFYLTPGLYHKVRRRSEIGIGIPLGVRGIPNSLGVVLKTNWEFGGEH